MKFFWSFLIFLQAYDGVNAQSAANKISIASGQVAERQWNNKSLITCNNWLRTQAVGQSVKIGDLDVIGNTITVEAQYNRVLPAANSYILEDIVSKHGDPANVNYLLRPDHAEITTTNGFFQTAPICITQPNRSYHVALVYNGSSLKFYRNGYLMSQVAVTGNMILNDLSTTIGDYAYPNPLGSNFYGYINEVRIWNTARTQAQIQSFMNSSLPNPSTQTGLLAYYTFESLLNKQGNAAWNGTLTGAATINSSNPDCFFITDSCNVLQGIENVINDYTPVVALNPCNNSILVEDAQEFNVGDTVLMIQMKGALIDSSNTTLFGNISNYRNAGNYEFNYVLQKTGNNILLKNKLTRQYDIPVGKVQLVRVPYYLSANITSTLTCAPWDGAKGGVLVLNVKDTATLNANIDVSGKGFAGAIGVNTNQLGFNCFQSAFFYNSLAGDTAAKKGEGIAILSDNKLFGRGKAANGGGGGNSHNAGGGGGSNAGSGGLGGYQLEACGNAPFENRGVGGTALQYNNTNNKIFLGGGGGAGHVNNPQGFKGSGGNGGGIAIIRARYINNTGKSIISNGLNAELCNLPGNACHEGMGGGGAGGTVILDVTNVSQLTAINVNGGAGGNMTDGVNGRLGPGGGGGGGLIWFRAASQPSNVTSAVNGGVNGKCINYSNDAWGATSGAVGSRLFNIILPVDSVLFKKNIDSVRITKSIQSCSSFDFQGLGFTNATPVTTWQWQFGDGATSSSQSTSHNYSTAGNFNVKLIVSDINGCKDSITTTVTTGVLTVNAGPDTSICINSSVVHTLQGSSTGTSYSWTPAAFLNNAALQNPIATISATTTFYLTASDASGCTGKDSVTVVVKPAPVVGIQNNPSMCTGDTLQLLSSGVQTFQWSPPSQLNNSTIASPVFTGTTNQTIIVTGVHANGCSARDTLFVIVKPKPDVNTIADTSICSNQSITLSTTGALSYSWSPGNQLSNPAIQNPVFTGVLGQTYIVTGTGANGCRDWDTVNISIRNTAFNSPRDKNVCIGNSVQLDGNNGPMMTYNWSPSPTLSGTNLINPTASPTVSTTYDVLIRNPACNSDSNFRVFVTVNNLPLINAAKANDVDCAHISSQLTASGAASYFWTPASTLNNGGISNPIATPQSSTQYIVSGTDIKGCTGSDSITVDIKTGNVAFYIANSFTPNGDGMNDCFGINHFGQMENLVFMIYNRYGEKVFETKNVALCWNGFYKGNPANAGAYVYYIKGKSGCGEIVRKGNLLLIR